MHERLTYRHGEAANQTSRESLALLVREDSGFACQDLITAIHENGLICDPAYIRDAYRDWLSDVVNIIGRYIDPEQYDFAANTRLRVTTDFYNAERLKDNVVENAYALTQQKGNAPAVYVTLDEMLHENRPCWAEIAISRLFNHEGRKTGDFVARPGSAPIEKQMAQLQQQVAALYRETNERPQVVLLEDNVRHGNMLNTIIGYMQESGVFQNADLAGVSSAFLCAGPDELAKIQHERKSITVRSSVDVSTLSADILTPRDLLMEGVVMPDATGEKHVRMPVIFLDLARRMKIRPDAQETVRQKICHHNQVFCKAVADHIGREDIPVQWFEGGDGVARVRNDIETEAPMGRLMQRLGNTRLGANANMTPG